MLYVFHVETGTMMTFDINLALESVSSLKVMIERVCRIPANEQVLVVSGGEVLRPEARVCSYSAGTDTNPIYMFNKTIIEASDFPRSHIDYGTEVDLREQLTTCISMASSSVNYSTVAACSQLAQQYYELARQHTNVCERLVHDQQLQQQGWTAVVANMEDVTNDFAERSEDLEKKFIEHFKKREEYAEFLENFNEDLEALSSIPILPPLRLNAASNPFTAFEDIQGEESYHHQLLAGGEEDQEKMPSLEAHTIIQTDVHATTGSNDGSSKTSSLQGTASEGDEGIESSQEQSSGGRLSRGRVGGRHSTREAITLLHWVTAKENQESLRDIAKFCKSALEMFDSSVMSTLKKEVAEALSSANQDGMKRIKGLEERLQGLEHLLKEARRIEQEQKDLAFSFSQNQQKALNLGDMSVLKVFCESHCQQLQSMQKNEQKLQDIKGRCARAKDELALNLYHRLRWIVYVENRMFETDGRLMIYHRSLTNLKKHLAVIGQLHRAPKLFCTAVHEIVRRRTFSQAFLAWASDLATHLLTIHNEEVSRRRSFNTLFAGHFLSGLFPGTNDEPPAFATIPPSPFDTKLPKLTQNDLQTLGVKMPHLVSELPPYDMAKVTQFFSQRSSPPDKPGNLPPVDERLLAVREAGVDRGFESETDTEEYEKVGQSPLLEGVSRGAPPPPPTCCDATTLTEVLLPPAKPPRKSLTLAKPHHVPLATIPQLSSPHQDTTPVGCVQSPVLFSPPELFSNNFISNSFTCEQNTFSDSLFLESPPGKVKMPPPSPSSPTALAPPPPHDVEPATFYIEESPPTSLHWSHSSEPLATLLQENQETQRRDVVSLNEMLSSVSRICTQSICALRNELGKLKSETAEKEIALKQECQNIIAAWEKFNAENAIKERETIQRLTVDHELELHDMKQSLAGKDDEITSLKLENKAAQSRYDDLVIETTKKISELELKIISQDQLVLEQIKKVEDVETSKQKSLKELQEKMAHDHKTEIESLRCRFRLMATTSMDRSPSESSLEKIERPDMIEITNHKAILAQTREDFEIEKEEAIKVALDKQKEEWKSKLAEELEKLKVKHDLEKQVTMNDAVRRIIEEKDRQLEQCRERETTLLRDCMKYKETIQQLSDPETSDFQSMSYLQTRLETLEAEKLCLENRLNERTCTTHSREQQTESVELKDSSTNPNSKSRQRWLHSQLFGMPLYNYWSSSEGETVMLVYDHEYSNFVILQDVDVSRECRVNTSLVDIVVNQAENEYHNEIMILAGDVMEFHCTHHSCDSPSIFLLHIDCLNSLELKIPCKDDEKINYYIGKVESKDYCVALKSRNRYNVPQGTRFYRIKVRPPKPCEVTSRQSFDISVVKEKESSQRRGSGIMSSSTMSSSSTSKSVIMVRSTRKSDEPSTSGVIAEDGEQPDSIELNIAEPDRESGSPDQESGLPDQESGLPDQESSRLPDQESGLPEESVPYEVSTNQERTGVVSSEHLISEVGEEATP